MVVASPIATAQSGAMVQALLRTQNTVCFPLQSSWTPQWASLKFYYKLDGSGTLSVGGAVAATVGPNGTMAGGASTYQAAQIGQGLGFDGSTTYVDLGGTFSTLDVSDLTLSVWAKPTAYPAAVAGIIDKDFDNTGLGGAYGGWGLWIGADGHPWFWAQAGKDLRDNGPATMALNTWTLVTVTFNATSKQAKFYVNGVLNSTQTDATIVPASSTGANFILGGIRNGGPAQHKFSGLIDEAAGWNLELTATEVKRLYDHQRCLAN